MSDLLNNAPLYYPEAREWMWTYCVYLGPYIDSEGRTYDLGVYIQPAREHEKPYSISRMSAAIVYGPEDGDYISGDLKEGVNTNSEVINETISRARALFLIH